MLAGTDGPEAFAVPGFRLHHELELLVGAGLTVSEALQTTTYNAAKFLGKLKSQGTVEPGKLADVVLLDANPLENIANTRRDDMVIAGGRSFRRPTSGCNVERGEASAQN